MVRDEPSANGQEPHAENSDPTIPQGSQPGPARAADFAFGTGNLTQELAQLLAATIAHNQAQRGGGGGLPTGSDLASLASLMQAASAQRTLQPTFKDGLSALSYAPPSRVPMEHGDADDDEPMPIPSTWRQPVQHERDRWFRQQMGAALLGLAAGLMIVVPTVLWLSGWIGGGQKSVSVTTASTADFVRTPEVKPVKVQVKPVDKPPSQVVTGSVQKVEPAVTIAAAKVQDLERARTDELLAQAAQRIENGDITGARLLLESNEVQAVGLATFALAETYDPNMLAAWGTRGIIADVAKARALYSRALSQGVNKAQLRLDALR